MRPCADVVPLIGPLLDGALAADDSAFVEEHVAGCPGCQVRKALISAQAAALRERLSARAAEARFDGFADRVLSRSRQDRGGGWDRARVLGSEVFAAHRRAFAAAGGLALAASVALAVLLTPPRTDEGALAQADPWPQIDEVDFGNHDGTVYELPDRTPVIWISDDSGGAR